MFDDIFKKAKNKLTQTFGLGQPGLGSFGQQVKNTFRPVANFARQNVVRPQVQRFNNNANAFRQASSFANRNIIRPQVARFQRDINTVKNNYNASPVANIKFQVPKYNPRPLNPNTSGYKADQFIKNKVVRPIKSGINTYNNNPSFLNKIPIRNQFANKLGITSVGSLLGTDNLTPRQKMDRIKSDPEYTTEMSKGVALNFMGGTGNKSTLQKIAPEIAKSRSALAIKEMIKTAGLDASKLGKSFLKELVGEKNPQKVAEMLNLLRKSAQKQVAQKIAVQGTKDLVGDANLPNTSQPAGKIPISPQKTTGKGVQAPTTLSDDLVDQANAPLQPTQQGKTLESSTIKPQSFDESISANQVGSQLIDDTKTVLEGGEVKERTFGQRVRASKNTPKEVKDMVGGSYVVKNNKQLQKDAQRLIKESIDTADEMATNPRNAVDIEVGNQLIVHYQANGNFNKAAEIANAMNKSLTEGGQFVQAASLYDKTSPSGIQRFAQGEVESFNKANPNKKISIDDKTATELFEKAQSIQKMAEGRERNLATAELFNQVADIIPTSGWKKAVTIWKAGLLTSPRTQLRNLVGGTLNSAGEIAKDPIAAISDIIMASRTGQRTKTATLQGAFTKKGFDSAKDFIYKGFDPEQTIQKLDVKRINWGKSKVGKVAEAYTNAVFRTLGAADKVFYHSALSRSLYDQAGAAAINSGKRGSKEFVENLVKNPTDDMLKIATRDAQTAVFQQSSAAGELLSKLKNGIKSKGEMAEAAGEFFLPFTQVPSGVASQLISYSPYGLAKGAINAARTMVTKNAGLQRQAAEDIGRGIVGTGIAALGYHLYKTGNMTGKYPADAKEREQWKLEGKQENSVKVAGKWRKLSSIGPQASMLVTGAQFAESREEGDAGVLKTASSMGSEFLEQPFIQGVSVPLDTLKDPERNAQKFANQSAGSLVPNIVKDVAKGTDPNKREAETALQSFQKGVPGWRNSLTPMRDAFGEPLPEEGGVAKNMFDLLNSTTPKGDQTTGELRRLLDEGEGATPSKLGNSQTIAGEKLKLKNEQLDAIETKAGPKIKQAFDEIIQSPEYTELNNEDKRKKLEKITEDARAVAKLEAASELDLVSQDKIAEKADKLTKDQKALLAGENPTFAKAKKDYETDEQISYLSGSYGLLELYKENGDYGNWNKEAENLLTLYNSKLENAETDKDKVYWQNKIINHKKDMQKFASYGGKFTKGKKGGGVPKFKAIDTSNAIKIPIRQAKKASFKVKGISTPKIPVMKSTGISKSYLSNLR